MYLCCHSENKVIHSYIMAVTLSHHGLRDCDHNYDLTHVVAREGCHTRLTMDFFYGLTVLYLTTCTVTEQSCSSHQCSQLGLHLGYGYWQSWDTKQIDCALHHIL